MADKYFQNFPDDRLIHVRSVRHRMSTTVKNCQKNCQKLSKMSKNVNKCQTCQKNIKIPKLSKKYNNVKNCQKD